MKGMPPSDSIRILVVEDEGIIAAHLQRSLVDLGYEVLDPVATGETAIERCEDLRPSLVLMDIQLAGRMDGIQAAQEIYQRWKVPIIFLTAYADDRRLEQARLATPYGYLIKPVQERELRAAIEIAVYKGEIDRKLHESEAKYRQLFNRMLSAFVMHEVVLDDLGQPIDFRILEVNPAFENITGRTAGEAVGALLYELFPDMRSYHEIFTRILQTGQPARFQTEVASLGRFSEVTAFRNQPGQLATIFIDITPQVNSLHALEESETRFRELAENIHELFWLNDAVTGQLIYVSPMFEHMWGYPREALLDEPKALLDTIHPDDRERVLDAIRAQYEKGEALNEEIRIQRADGKTRIIWARTYPIYDGHGKRVRMAGIAEDVTERRMVEENLRASYDMTIKGWAKALELRDKETYGHSDRVTDLTMELARRLGVQEDELIHWRRGVFLHDIGKMAIPDHILHKTGPLSPEEWQLMREHPLYAFEMLRDIPYLAPALNIPLYHHEKWDGTGYPEGKKGEQIPFSARVFSAVDVWDALLSKRSYRPAWEEAEALEYLRCQRGVHFDPQVVSELLSLLEEQRPQDSKEGPSGQSPASPSPVQ